MVFLRLIFIFFLVFLFSGAMLPRKKMSSMEIISHMLDSVKHIKTQSYDLKATERVNGKFLHAESTLKINTTPKKIYFKSKLKGVEVLWIQGQNKGDAIVHSPSFTLANLNLDPYGSLMRKDQHHTIFELGLQQIGIIVANTIVKAPKDFEKHFAYAGTIVFNNKECHQLLINYPEYKYVEYTVQKGESVTDIARKMHTSDYKIRYKNELSGYYTPLKEGKKIMIPMPYASKVLMYIDKKSYLPVSVKIYDEEGLFEAYDFFNISTNKTFSNEEFSVNYKGYNFRKN